MTDHKIVHWELMGPDGDKLAAFYSNLFGWELQSYPGMNDYNVVDAEQSGVGGAIGSGNENMSSWLMNVDSGDALQPEFEELPGWQESTVGATDINQLPDNARAYIRFIEQIVEAPVDIISTGPDRAETIVLKHPFG